MTEDGTSITTIPEGYVRWDGKAGDIVPDGALCNYLGIKNRWTLAMAIGLPCHELHVGCYAVPAPEPAPEPAPAPAPAPESAPATAPEPEPEPGAAYSCAACGAQWVGHKMDHYPCAHVEALRIRARVLESPDVFIESEFLANPDRALAEARKSGCAEVYGDDGEPLFTISVLTKGLSEAESAHTEAEVWARPDLNEVADELRALAKRVETIERRMHDAWLLRRKPK